MSKTASMAMMALDWVKGKAELQKFDFFFLIRLRYADKESSLAELIISQHNRLEVRKIQTTKIKAIIEGDTKHKTLLMLDGYDEYKPGTNKDIDDAIEKTVGTSVLILTSHPGYLSRTIRSTMRNIATIKGFSQENIMKTRHEEGYVDRDIWSHLQNYVKADVLSGTFSQLTVSSGNTMVTGTSYQLSEEGKRFILSYINSAFTKKPVNSLKSQSSFLALWAFLFKF